jgi:hypothetical protein
LKTQIQKFERHITGDSVTSRLNSWSAVMARTADRIKWPREVTEHDSETDDDE